jgi:H+/Cl- antiporter ClcA
MKIPNQFLASFLLLRLQASDAFLDGASTRRVPNVSIVAPNSQITRMRAGSSEPFNPFVAQPPSTTSTVASTPSASTTATSEDDSILPASICVGAITAAMGFIYGKVLGLSVKTIWTTLPSLLLERFGSINPTYFITSICTVGGLLMGVLSSKLGSTFAVGDFVSALSSLPAQTLPSTRVHLFPLLLLSLVTSTFGFSVGPEAPMVCAGGLVGASLARFWYSNDDAMTSKRHQETLAYAGAAGALTAFMGIPIAGSIFALELTRSNAALSRAGDQALAPAVVASLSALVVIRALLAPSISVGGHFTYGAVGALSGRAMMATAITFGAGGALIGTLFHKLVSNMKKIAWQFNKKEGGAGAAWKRQLLVKTVIGLLVGILSSNFPQTLFWGEGSLQCMIDGQQTAFEATKHGLSSLLTGAARVDPSVPFAGASAAVQVGVAKLIAIALACAGKFPGGIIFPLFFAAAPLAHACASLLPSSSVLLPVAVMCLMASTQAAVTKTPLATALILSLTASATTELSVLLPACLVSSYLGVYLSRQLSRNSYFQYSDS